MVKRYVDGFVLVVPTKNLDAYKKMANSASNVWMKYGALQYFECIGDDLNPDTQGMKIKTFTQLTKKQPDEEIIFAFVVYKSRAHRDRVNAKVMKDPAMCDPNKQPKVMPFDMKRMAWGGFSSIIGKEI